MGLDVRCTCGHLPSSHEPSGPCRGWDVAPDTDQPCGCSMFVVRPQLPRYGEVDRCVKCGMSTATLGRYSPEDYFLTHYISDPQGAIVMSCLEIGCDRLQREHLHRRCPRCSYEWAEEVVGGGE